jgi:hypothetical protein
VFGNRILTFEIDSKYYIGTFADPKPFETQTNSQLSTPHEFSNVVPQNQRISSAFY